MGFVSCGKDLLAVNSFLPFPRCLFSSLLWKNSFLLDPMPGLRHWPPSSASDVDLLRCQVARVPLSSNSVRSLESLFPPTVFHCESCFAFAGFPCLAPTTSWSRDHQALGILRPSPSPLDSRKRGLLREPDYWTPWVISLFVKLGGGGSFLLITR